MFQTGSNRFLRDLKEIIIASTTDYVFVQVAREAYFSGQSYLDLGVTNVSSLMSNFYASFSFRTDQTEGLMFYHKDQVRRTSVLLVSVVFLPEFQLLMYSLGVCLAGRQLEGVSE